jgi:hypothetical protein
MQAAPARRRRFADVINMTRARENTTSVFLFALFSALVFWEFLFGDKLALFKDIGSDSITIFLPMLHHFVERVQEGRLWGFSFQPGLGQAYLLHHTHAGLFSLPLWLVPPLKLPAVLGLYEAVKLVVGGVFAAAFVRERGASATYARAAGLLFMGAGYFAIGNSWPQVTVEAPCAAWMFFGAERFVRRGSPFAFVFGCFFMTTLQPTWTWVAFVGVVAWIFGQHIVAGQWRTGVRQVFGLGLLAALGVLLAGIFVLPQLHMMANSPRGTGGSSLIPHLMSSPWTLADGKQLATAYLRSFAADVAGNGHGYRGWGNFLEGPLYASGTLCLLVLPAAWGRLSREQRRLVVLFLAATLSLTLFPWLRRAYWIFTGDYYRHINITVSLVCIALTVEALGVLQKQGGTKLGALAWTLLLLSPLALTSVRAIAEPSVVTSICIHVALGLVVVVFASSRLTGWLAPALCLVFVFVDGVTTVRRSLHDRPTMTRSEDVKGKGYRDATEDVVASMQEVFRPPFRTTKLYSSGLAKRSSLNDGMMQNYFGVMSYASFNLASTARFFEAVGLANMSVEATTRWLKGIEKRPLVQGFVGARLLLAQKRQPALVEQGFVALGERRGLHAYENPWWIPWVTQMDTVVPKESFRALSVPARERALFVGPVVDDAPALAAQGLRVATASELSLRDDELRARVETLRTTAPPITSFQANEIRAQTHNTAPSFVLFTVPADSGWSVTVDGTPAEVLSATFGFWGVVVPAGSHEVVATYRVPGVLGGGVMTALASFILVLLFVRRRRQGLVGTLSSPQSVGASAA